jgi:hypothetical protein
MNTAEDNAPTGADKKVPSVVENDFDDVSIPPAPDDFPSEDPTEDSARPTEADKKVPCVIEHDFDEVYIPPAPANVPTAGPLFSAGAIAANKERQEREEENAPFHAFADSKRKLRVATNKKANEKKRPGIKGNTLVEDNKARILEISDAARAGKLQPMPFILVSTKVCEMKQPESWP